MNHATETLRTLSIVVPCFNEHKTLAAIVDRIMQAPASGLARELILVDDGSTDGSREVIRELVSRYPAIRFIAHAVNAGKGAALRTGFQAATGDIVLIQDADLEYDPCEYPKLLKPILDGRADVVYGSRFRGGETVRVLYFWHQVANKILTFCSNLLTNLTLTDMETCYKVFRREVIQGIRIQEERFGFEPEITAKIARIRPPLRIYEVAISYYGRTYQEGKKIGWKDAVRALYCIIRYNLFAGRT
ncbi:MAG: glycosyltransferase family 2 protein [Magnetococcales bacterium]|nr:glycosyltransferase family 2 protein [Magnetococcales bacterium]